MDISEFKQQFLWEQVIISWGKHNNIESINLCNYNSEYLNINLNSWKLAEQAKEACYMLQFLGISLQDLRNFNYNHEINTFIVWSNAYHQKCTNSNYTAKVPLRFKAQWGLIKDIPLTQKKICSELYKVSAVNFIEELHYAARWANSMLSSGASIGIFIPELEHNYGNVDYIFSNYLDQSCYKFNLNLNIRDFAFINIGFLILKLTSNYLNSTKINYNDFNKLLTTSFTHGSASELGSRFFLDYILRDAIGYEFTWNELKLHLSKFKTNYTTCNIDIFLNILTNFENFLHTHLDSKCGLDHKLQYNCNGWSEFITTIMAIFGWGITNLDEKIGALTQLWKEIGAAYLELDDILSQHEFNLCLNILYKLLDSVKFNQINLSNLAATKKAITIMGLDFNGAAAQFDYVWLCGASDVGLAIKRYLNPFVPREIQQKFWSKCFAGAGDILQQLITHTTTQLICSYPFWGKDEIKVTPSQLIIDFSSKNFMPWINEAKNSSINTDITKNIERYEDSYTTSYASSDLPGIQALKLHIACPFKANAKVRLRAYELKEPQQYLTQQLQEQHLRKTLAYFWQYYRDLKTVKTLSSTELYQKLLQFSLQHLNGLKEHRSNLLSPTMIKLESERVAGLCYDFMTKHELLRRSFEVLQIDPKFTGQLQDGCIKIKVDRIDQLDNGNLLIIDYTRDRLFSKYINEHKGLFLDHSSLIIYSLMAKMVQGMILVKIKNDEISLSGILNDDPLLQLEFSQDKRIKILPKLDAAYLSEITQELNRVAKEFKNGVAWVNPKYGPKTCKHCDLDGFCRINSRMIL